MGEHREFKLGVHVHHSKAQPTALKGAWSRHMTHKGEARILRFGGLSPMAVMACA